MTTPEKIEYGLDILNKSSSEIRQQFDTIISSSQKIYSSTSTILDVYDDLPLDRLRNIRPLIEDVLDKKDKYADELSRLETLKHSIDLFEKSVKTLNSYFSNIYMESVRARESRDR